ncbi:hypothetical protein T190611E02C_30121 [Tenacibaculum sp. 190524A05c]
MFTQTIKCRNKLFFDVFFFSNVIKKNQKPILTTENQTIKKD